MLDGPKQNWKLYEEKCRGAHIKWMRSFTPTEALGVYQDLWRLTDGSQAGHPSFKRMKQMRWKEKLAIRRKLVEGFTRLDRIKK